jgi:hypothetical protein
MWRITVALTLSGCSFLSVRAPGTAVHTQCPGRALPITDATVATLALGVFGFVLIDALSSKRGGEFFGQLVGIGHATGETDTENAVARPSLLIGVPYLASAIYGFIVTSRCS